LIKHCTPFTYASSGKQLSNEEININQLNQLAQQTPNKGQSILIIEASSSSNYPSIDPVLNLAANNENTLTFSKNHIIKKTPSRKIIEVRN
jgi:hypothetical protein